MCTDEALGKKDGEGSGRRGRGGGEWRGRQVPQAHERIRHSLDCAEIVVV